MSRPDVIRKRTARPPGFTLIEVLVALFILLMGIVGVLAAMPTAVGEAEWVIFQDAAINLAHSKFAEFRRDHMEPSQPGWTGYLNKMGTTDPKGFRPFLLKSGSGASGYDINSPYYFFDDIQKYKWKVDWMQISVGSDHSPVFGGSTPGVVCNLVSVTVEMAGSKRYFVFKQIMTPYE